MLESYSPSSATSSVEAWDVPQAPPPGFHKDALPGSTAPPPSMLSASHCPSRARSRLMEED